MRRHEIIQAVRPLNTQILFRLDFGPFVVNWGVNGTFESVLYLKNFVCKLKPIIIESYTESNESLKITRLRNPIVCFGLLLKQTQAYIYIRLIASGIDKIHNCPKCLKRKTLSKVPLTPQFTTNGPKSNRNKIWVLSGRTA
jgi:hypothetical protein